MSSQSIDFFPPALKWLSIGCFTILTGSFIIIYLSTPTLSLDDYVIEEDVAGLTTNSQPVGSSLRSNQGATLSEHPESTSTSQTESPNRSVTAHSQGQIESESEAEPDSTMIEPPTASSQGKNENEQHLQQEPIAQSSTAHSESKSSDSCHGKKREIIGLIRIRPKQQKVYFSPRHHPVEYKLIQKGIPGAKLFCSEEEAKKHGYKLAQNSYLRYYTKHLFR